MRINFTADTDIYQILGEQNVKALAEPGWRLQSIRGERVNFLGRERQFLDITLGYPQGRTVVLLMVEVFDESPLAFNFPQRFIGAGDKFIYELAAEVAPELEALKIKGNMLAARFYVDKVHQVRVADQGRASERLVPGQSPYGTLMAHLRRYHFVRSVVNIDKSVLDLGCGTGYGMRLMDPEKGCGIDVSKEAVEFAEKMYGGDRLGFIQSDIEHLDLGSSFDTVTAFEVLEHLSDHHALFDTAVRHLKDDGTFVISLPNPAYHGSDINSYHVRDLTIEHLSVMMRDRFEEVNFYCQAHDIHGDLSDRYKVMEGISPDAEFWIATGRKTKPARSVPKVSIVIPVFNKAEYTAACLNAIAQYTPEDDFAYEVVIVDNASTDGTVELLSHVQGDVTVWRNEENLGFARANNQGSLLARGEIMVFLNNDTEVKPGWLNALTDELDNNPETGIVGGKLLYPDGSIQHAGVAIGRDQIPFHIHRGLSADHPLVTERRSYPIVTAACIAVRRKGFYEIGMFDEKFINGHEDIDLCFRYRQSNRKIIYRPDCVVTHHESVSEGRMNSRPKNLERTFSKWRYQLNQDDFRYSYPESEREKPLQPLTFAIKIGPPDRTYTNWGDIYFSECLARALTRKGHRCLIHYLNEWGRDDLDVDVVIHLKGLSEYHPKPYNINILWMLNHPSLHSNEELSRYDAVLVASYPHADYLKTKINVPVFPFLQATDPEHFKPQPDVKKEFDIVFVGNNNGAGRMDMRMIVADLLPTRHKLGVWGEGWEGKLPEGVWQGKFVPWADLPKIYAGSLIALNDHQPDMKNNGFVNNRTFDAVACGSIVVSDHVKNMEDVLPVPCYTKRKELRQLVYKILSGKSGVNLNTDKLRARVMDSFTFDHRAVEMLEIADSLTNARKRAKEAVGRAPNIVRDEKPLVSVLMSTYNRREYLPAAIASIRQQSYPHWELILVNDGGTPVEDIVFRENDRRIHLINLPKHSWKGHAINSAFVASRGDFIAYLDDDDIWYPDHLERLLLPLMTVSGMEMTYSDAYDVTLEEDEKGSFKETKRELRYQQQVTIGDLLGQNHVQGMVVVHRRNLFSLAGGMDEQLRVLIDWDLWRRMAAVTYPYHVSRITADHFFRNSNSTTGKGQITTLARTDTVRYLANRLRVIKKNLPLPPDSPYLSILESLRIKFRYDFLITLAGKYEKSNKEDSARCCYLIASRLMPKAINALSGLGKLELSNGKPKEALSYFMKCLNTDKSNISNFIYAALCCIVMKNGKDALTLLSEAGSIFTVIDEGSMKIIEEYRNRARQLLCSQAELTGHIQ